MRYVENNHMLTLYVRWSRKGAICFASPYKLSPLLPLMLHRFLSFPPTLLRLLYPFAPCKPTSTSTIKNSQPPHTIRSLPSPPFPTAQSSLPLAASRIFIPQLLQPFRDLGSGRPGTSLGLAGADGLKFAEEPSFFQRAGEGEDVFCCFDLCGGWGISV